VDVATYGIKIDASGAIVGLQKLGSGLSDAEKAAKKLEDRKVSLEKVAKRVGATLGLALTAALWKVYRSTVDNEAAISRLDSVIRVTGASAGFTAKALQEYAQSLSRATGIATSEIIEAQARLASYTGIVGERFKEATAIAVDWNRAYGGGMVAAAEAVGKALNFPTLGMAALSKQGFILTDAQKEQIKYYEQTNQLVKAQDILISELRGVLDGQAEDYRKKLPGAIDATKERLTELFTLSESSARSLTGWINTFGEFLGRINDNITETPARELEKLDKRIAAYREILGRVRPGSRTAQDAQEGITSAQARIDEILRLAREESAARRKAEDNARSGAPTGFQMDEAAMAALDKLKAEFGDFANGLVGTAEELENFGRVFRQAKKDADAAFSNRILALDEWDEAVRRVEEQHQADSLAAFEYRVEQAERADAAVRAIEEQYEADRLEAFRTRMERDAEATKRLEEIAKHFTEQVQIIGGRFFSDFFRNGLSSIRGFWESFKNLAFDVLGQLASRAVMNAIGDRMPKSFGGGIAGTIAGGIGVGVFASVIDGMLNAGKAAQQMAAAMADSARNIEQFARFATDRDLTDLQRQRRDMTEQRDALARQAVGAAGISGFSGNYDEAIEAAENFLRITGNKRYEELIRQLRTLGKAYEANIDSLTQAMKEAGEAAARAAAAEKLLSLQRTIGSLESFRRDIRSSNLSIYSPFQQLDDARGRYESLVAAARGGDQSAAEQLPAAARAFLEQSRSINASGARYVADFQRVESDTAFIMERFERQADEQRAILDETVAQTGILTAMRFQLERTDPYLEAQVTLQQEIARGIVEMREAIVEELRGVSREIRVFTGLGNEPILIAGG
jgi:hypothetical protein